MPALAIDIGSYTIKAVAGKTGDKIKVEKAVEIFNNTGVVMPNDDAQMEKLIEALKNLIADHKLPTADTRLALPESAVSTKVIQMPRLSDAELASAIGWQAEQYIPIPPEELELEYKVLYRPDKNNQSEQMRVLLVGARKSVLERFVTVFNYLGIEPTIMETQILSIVRSLQFAANEPATLMAHIGASTMVLAVVRQGELDFVFNHMTGSQALTRALEQTIGLTTEQAEQYKRQYGLDPSQFQGKVREALLPAVKVLTDAMLKAGRFFTSQRPQEQIQRIVLSGGGAQLPGLVEHVTQTLATEVLMSSPFATSSGSIPESNQVAMAVCMGLLSRIA